MRCSKIAQAQADYISKEAAYTMLHISRSKFDSLVAEGKIPEGIHQRGIKSLMWHRKVIEKLIGKL